MKPKQILSILFMVLGVLFILYYGLILRFTYPDMTAVRLFLTYWYGYVAAFICVMISALLNDKYEKRWK